jgi:uncharacterized repeat protein (TIGR01451 family)
MKNDFPKWLRVCCWLLPALALAQADHNKLARKKADVFDLKIRVSPADTIACVTQTVDVHISYKNLAGEVLSNFEVHTWFPNELTKYFVFQEVLYAPGNRQPSTDFCRIDHAIWQLGTLQFNQQDSIIYRLHLARRPFRLTTFTYRAEARAGDIHSPQVAASHIFAPKGSGCGEPPDLSIRKSASKNPASVGDEVRFTLTVSNSFADQFNVVVEDFVPAGLAVDTARITPRFDSFQKLADGSHIVRWSFPGRFAAGTSMPLTIPTKVTLNPLDRTGLVNRCKVEGEVTELYCENNYYNFTPPTHPLSIDYLWIDPKYDIRLTFLGDKQDSIKPGKPETYQLAITNLSTVWVENLTLQLDIDDALFDRDCYTIKAISGGGVPVSNTQVRWHIGRLDSAETDTVSLTLVYDKIQYTELGQRVKFVAEIDRTFRRNCGQILFFPIYCEDLNPADNEARWERTKDFKYDLALDSINCPPGRFDVRMPYRLTVRNVSGVELPATTLHVNLAQIDKIQPDRISIFINGDPGILPAQLRIPKLAPDDSSTHKVEVLVDAHEGPGPYGFMLQAGVAAITGESDTTNNRSECQTIIIPKYDLRLAFAGDSLATITPNASERYELDVQNLSTFRVDSVVLVLNIDDGLADRDCYTITGNSHGPIPPPNTPVRWVIAGLNPDATQKRSLILRYDRIEASSPIQKVNFVAAVDTLFRGRRDPNPADNTDRWERTKDLRYDVRLAFKGDSLGVITPNATERYALEVKNLSALRVDSIQLVLNIDDGMPDRDCYSIAGITDGGDVLPNGLVRWLLNLEPGETRTPSLTLRYDNIEVPSATQRVSFVAQVDTLIDGRRDQNPADNVDRWERRKDFKYDLVLESLNCPSLRFDISQRYRITLKNNSAARMRGVKLHAKVISASPELIAISSPKDWPISSLVAAQDTTVDLIVMMKSPDAPGAHGLTVQAWAEVIAGENDTTNNAKTCEAGATLTYDLALAFKGAAQGTIRPNQDESYQIEVRNHSTFRVDSVWLALNIDDGMEGRNCYSITGSSHISSREILPDGVRWRLRLDPDEATTYSVTLRYDSIAVPIATPKVLFVAQADTLFRNRRDQKPLDNADRWERTKEVTTYDLVLEPTPSNNRPQAEFNVSEQYSLVVKNASAVYLPAFMLHVKLDTLPGTLSARIEISGEQGLSKSWPIPSLAPNDTAMRELKAAIKTHDDPGRYCFKVMAWADTISGEFDPGNNSREWETCVTGEPRLRLASIQPPPEKLRFAQEFTWSFRYKNEGNVPAPEVILTVALPEAITVESGEVTVDSGKVVSLRDTSARLGNLPPDFEGAATLQLRVINREGLLDKYKDRQQTAITVTFEAGLSSKNADSASLAHTSALEIPQAVEAFYLSHNLFRPGLDNVVELYIDVIDNTEVRFRIYNVAGELVRAFAPKRGVIGSRVEEHWDGRNDRGDYVGSGLYFVFAEVDYKRERPSRRLVVVR